MKVGTLAVAIQSVTSEMIVVGVFQGVDKLSGAAAAVDDAMAGAVSRVLADGDFSGKDDETLLLYQQASLVAKRVLLVGLGERDMFSLVKVRNASAADGQAARRIGVTTFHSVVHGAGAGGLDARGAAQAIVEGAILGTYAFPGYAQRDNNDADALEEMTLMVYAAEDLPAVRAGAQAGKVIAEAACLTRDLVSEPANYLTPSILADRAQSMADKHGLDIHVLDKTALTKEQMGALLAVAQGSSEPPRMIVLEHNAGREDLETVVVVGKGITFDSGGISIKPVQGMELMKYDMAGAAVTLGVLRAVADLDLPLHVVGLVPATENLPGGRAYKPGDVVTSRSGLTIEVISTDAEGRLILADALDYAKQFEPKAVVDLATLTGGCMVALGPVAAGMMTKSPELASALRAAADSSGERVWELPLYPEYAMMIKSPVADVKNSGGRFASAITAGMFLSLFADELPWVHLDIAGTAWALEGHGCVPKGATGYGVRLLVQWLRTMAQEEEPLEA